LQYPHQLPHHPDLYRVAVEPAIARTHSAEPPIVNHCCRKSSRCFIDQPYCFVAGDISRHLPFSLEKVSLISIKRGGSFRHTAVVSAPGTSILETLFPNNRKKIKNRFQNLSPKTL
jgi:hypothetical protein